ncbi:hypothetical protein S40293_01400 [Stachybotrys chartarum IBT 40293]|nr:hypothetical protein S40293_01400 [Stachybotrys chartarum IBT 40293]
MAGLIDPTVTGKYPVVLGEGLLSTTSNDIFTGIKYNHKPPLSTGDAPDHARLKPSLPGKTSSYDLSFMDAEGSYAYAGTRNTNDNQYVLHFDPARKVFVLDRVDSTFNMNLTRLPNNTDPDSLSRRFPHLELQEKPKPNTSKPILEKEKPKPAKPVKSTPKQMAKSPLPMKEPKRKPEKKKEQSHAPLNLPKPQPLSLPKAQPAKEEPKQQRKKQEEEEDEEEDDDGGLTIEYPGAELGKKRTDFSPAFPSVRRFDEFMDRRESESDDADGETDGEAEIEFKLPSPVNHHENKAAAPSSYSQPETQRGYHQESQQEQQNGFEPEVMDMEEEDDENDLAADLEKDLEDAFDDMINSQKGSPDGDESEISEED